MLRYLNGGTRRFGITPMAPHGRLHWEFYAVLSGVCGVVRESGEKLPVTTSHLWVFPPHHIHGWHGGPTPCEVAVFHFGFIPSALEDVVRLREFLERSLTPGECVQIGKLMRALQSDYENRTAMGELRSQRGLLDLALIAMADEPVHNLSLIERRAGDKVEAAIAWFRQHLRDKPGIEDVARAAHVSTSHLRRLFASAGRGSPHDALNKVRIEVAMRLMRETDLKLDSVAGEAGFASASDFSRVFKAGNGSSPREWRMANPPPYRPETEECPLGNEDV